MKFCLAGVIAASIFITSVKGDLYTGDAISGVDDSASAEAFCQSNGGTLPTEEQWCRYATDNPGVVYGLAPFKGIEPCYANVETLCGITPPSRTPRAGGIRTTSGKVGGRKLQECEEANHVLCIEVQQNVIPIPGGTGDPHFKTWTGDKFDYHGECDLVLVDNPSFADGLGLKLYVRTTRIKYYSYIERAALQIGDDILEFANDVENFLINGEPVGPNRKYHKSFLAGYLIRRDKRAISVRLNKETKAKIEFFQRRIGFPSVRVDAAGTDIFKGSLGLLGDSATGKKLARDGETEMVDIEEFALEWQVRDTEPLLFQDARFPQYPTLCTPPEKMMTSRLGMSHMQEEAEKVCAAWGDDKDDCIFDVIATRDIGAADGFSQAA